MPVLYFFCVCKSLKVADCVFCHKMRDSLLSHSDQTTHTGSLASRLFCHFHIQLPQFLLKSIDKWKLYRYVRMPSYKLWCLNFINWLNSCFSPQWTYFRIFWSSYICKWWMMKVTARLLHSKQLEYYTLRYFFKIT